MHLKQLKIAGFKTFVDPSTIDFLSPLVAIVGPNGCGKSNIIDAVRWVLGESSAKHLRGESMTDVIFNGSSGRKAIGQASVELLFDNQLGRLQGPFTKYAEISVKRLLTRDGVSNYYLNGQLCRRKDIRELFLGTGASARGYSIIGQDTISRIITAKPEELRAFLEEAAGVSQYKERRRETLDRVKNTREHLSRVNDLKRELDKQLDRLSQQAKSARQYTALKQEEERYRTEIQALKWKALTEEQTQHQQILQDLELAQEQQYASWTSHNKSQVVLLETLRQAEDQAQKTQDVLYQIGGQITHLEAAIQQQKNEKARLENEQANLQADLDKANKQSTQDQQELTERQEEAQGLTTTIEDNRKEYEQAMQAWQEAQQQQSDWQAQWQSLDAEKKELTNSLHISTLHLNHLEKTKQQTLIQLEKCQQEHSGFYLQEQEKRQEQLNQAQLELRTELSENEEALQEAQTQQSLSRNELHTLEQQLQAIQARVNRLHGEKTALEAVQKNQFSQTEKPQASSLLPPLIAQLEVEEAWQPAYEFLFKQSLKAQVLSNWEDWPNYVEEGVHLLNLRVSSPRIDGSRLSDKIKGLLPTSIPSLESIYTAVNLEEGRRLLDHLAAHESIVTLDGFWLGTGFIHSMKAEDHSGILARQEQLSHLKSTLQTLENELSTHQTACDSATTLLEQKTLEVAKYQLQRDECLTALNAHQLTMVKQQEVLKQTQIRLQQLNTQTEEFTNQLEDIQIDQQNTIDEQSRLQSLLDSLHPKLEILHAQKQDLTNNSTQSTLEIKRNALHQLERALDKAQTSIQEIKARIAREETYLERIQQRLNENRTLYSALDNPSIQLVMQHAEAVEQHKDLDLTKRSQQEELSSLKQALAEISQHLQQDDQALKMRADKIHQHQIQEQALSVRAKTIEEALNELDLQVQTLCLNLHATLNVDQHEADLLRVLDKIKRLGAINLAAIDELATEEARQTAIEAQCQDLNEALAILEKAIIEMDQETQERMKNTFDEINRAFQILFPRLFGGGSASLLLSTDNLLEAGITVSARPPGKKNSSIHLLSGGEKAMTAVALIFAIFQLNPSPFCMLDEVDAPLDEANVRRFCDLVKEMSQYVQFLFITHNKVTMELADHLIGVTMREPGVSRLVTVATTE